MLESNGTIFEQQRPELSTFSQLVSNLAHNASSFDSSSKEHSLSPHHSLEEEEPLLNALKRQFTKLMVFQEQEQPIPKVSLNKT